MTASLNIWQNSMSQPIGQLAVTGGNVLGLGVSERLGRGVNCRMTSDGLGRGVARDDSHATALTNTAAARSSAKSAERFIGGSTTAGEDNLLIDYGSSRK
jgi:hypothetical protein